MKKIYSALIFCALALSAAGCASTQEEKSQIPEAPEEKIIVTEIQTPESIFLKSLDGISFSFTQTPKVTNVNKAFSSPFSFVVKNSEGKELPDFEVSVSYPSAKKNGQIIYKTINGKTDEKGTYSFAAPVPAFAASTKLYAYATPVSQDVENEAKNAGAQADWKVKSDIITKGAVLFVWDFNEKDRPVNNSYEILSEFRTRGMTLVGNAPVNETADIGKPLATLYKKNYAIIENAYGYLIVGTIKFFKPVEECEGGYLCSLVSEISAVNMKNGEVIFTSTFTNEAVGQNWTKSIKTCKEQLAKQIVDAIVYGL